MEMINGIILNGKIYEAVKCKKLTSIADTVYIDKIIKPIYNFKAKQ